MKKVLFILMGLLIFASCGKDEPYSPIDDEKDFLIKNPYGVTFENATESDLFITCDKLSSNLIIVKTGAFSDPYHTSNDVITIKYKGEGTHWAEKTKTITLEKGKTTNVVLTYP